MADTKNWTWVLERRCPECHFEVSRLGRDEIAAMTRSTAARYTVYLVGDASAVVRRRNAPEVWSALEYGCHVRDVFTVMGRRVELMVAEDGPTFANWDQDATAADEHYDADEPTAVNAALLANGLALADAFDALSDDQWSRPGYRSDGASFTVESLGRYMLHDIVHHVWDLEEGPAALGPPAD